MTLAELLTHWKGILGSIAAVLVVLLQVIQVLLSTGIEQTLDTKTAVLQANADKLRQLVGENGEVSKSNGALLAQIHDEIHRMEQDLAKK